MAYQALNEDTVIDYVKSRPIYQEIFAENGQLTAKEVGDGNINLVFVVEDSNNSKSVVLKQALPYVRILGDSWPLTRERIKFEANSLQLYNELTPGLAPEVYEYDVEMALVGMENLNRHKIMRQSLVARETLPDFADHISTFMARILFFTSDLYLTGQAKKQLQAQYINPAMCKIQEDFVFSNPFMDSEENQWNPLLDDVVKEVRRNVELKLAIADLKERYMTHGQALIHSDLHTGSLMVNERDTRVIDSEFAFYGPMGFDIGAVLENIVLNCLSHYGHTPDKAVRTKYQHYLLEMVRSTWNLFAQKFDELWQANNKGELVPSKYWDFDGGSKAFSKFRRRYILKLLQDSAGFGGCKMLRRMMGVVSVWDISSIQNLETRAIAEKTAVKIGIRWIMERYQITTVDELIAIVQQEMDGVDI